MQGKEAGKQDEEINRRNGGETQVRKQMLVRYEY